MTERSFHFALARLATRGLLVSALAAGCHGATSDPVGGETHFLRACDTNDDLDSCGTGLDCICGVCTVACNEPTTCPLVSGVDCVSPPSTCTTGAPTGLCDLGCSSDADCAELSGSHACANGFCRAGAPSVPPSSVEPLSCEPASVRADQVLVIGDNLFAGGNDVIAPLVQSARDASVLASGEDFTNHSSATNDALAFQGGGIADQYAAGNPNGTMRLVVMTGGGVDAIFGTCAELDTACPTLVSAADAAATLLDRMAGDGVEHVVYVFYPDAGDPDQKARVDLLRTLIEPICSEARVPCHLLDLREVFEGHYDQYVIPEVGLSVEGAKATADAIWSVIGICMVPGA